VQKTWPRTGRAIATRWPLIIHQPHPFAAAAAPSTSWPWKHGSALAVTVTAGKCSRLASGITASGVRLIRACRE
jgi:hypothetical protein